MIAEESMLQLLNKAKLMGFLEGLEAYAYWNDGTQYVGSCGTTLDKAMKDAQLEGTFANPIKITSTKDIA